jgi:hypothetical protein
VKLLVTDPIDSDYLLIVTELWKEWNFRESVIVLDYSLRKEGTIFKVNALDSAVKLRTMRLELLIYLICVIKFLH